LRFSVDNYGEMCLSLYSSTILFGLWLIKLFIQETLHLDYIPPSILPLPLPYIYNIGECNFKLTYGGFKAQTLEKERTTIKAQTLDLN